MTDTTRIAIIGGGFSGTLLLAHLMRQTERPLHIRWYEQSGRFAEGLAYGTKEMGHLLNVPTAKMGAYDDRHDDFYTWLQQQPEHINEKPDGFAPRAVYARYIKNINEQSLQYAQRNGHTLECISRAVTDIQTQGAGIQVTDTTEHWQADHVVLATGHARPRYFAFEEGLGQPYLANPWGAQAPAFWQWFGQQHWQPDAQVAIIGTGLTAVDMLHSLLAHGYAGRIILLSRNGLLPEPHATEPLTPSARTLEDYPQTADALIAMIRADMESAANWRNSIDGLRPITNALWQRLPLEEQKRFLKHYATWWGVKRHRMPVPSARVIETLQQAGRLEIRASGVEAIMGQGDKLRVQAGEAFDAVAAINASGFDYQLSKSRNEFLRHLSETGYITPHPLGIGIVTDGEYGCIGNAAGKLWALGPLLFGERLESTAVPELRTQTRELAEQLVNKR